MIRVIDSETPTDVVFDWAGDPGDEVVNAAGFIASHTTQVLSGVVMLDAVGFQTVKLGAGSRVFIPVRTPFRVYVLETATMRCLYPKADPNTARDTAPIRNTGSGPNTEKSLAWRRAPVETRPPEPTRTETGDVVLQPRSGGQAPAGERR